MLMVTRTRVALIAEVVGRHPAQDTLGEVARLGVGGLGQQHDELLAAVARHDVHRALLPLEP